MTKAALRIFGYFPKCSGSGCKSDNLHRGHMNDKIINLI